MQDSNERDPPLSDLEFERRLVKNTAFVGFENQKRILNESSSNEGVEKKIIYVFDTSIIKTFCAPFSSGPMGWKDGNAGFGQIMPRQRVDHLSLDDFVSVTNEEIKNATNVSKSLADIVLSLTLDPTTSAFTPLFQLNAHYKETVGVYKAVRANLARSSHKSTGVGERFDRDIQLKIALMNSKRRRLHETSDVNLETVVKDLVWTLLEKGSLNKPKILREWDNFIDLHRRFGGLFSTNSLNYINSNEALDQQSADKTALANIVSEVQCAIQLNSSTMENQILEFEREVNSFKKGMGSAENIRTDAEALTELFEINDRIDKARLPFKMVLITADKNLTNAMANSTKIYGKSNKFDNSNYINNGGKKFGYSCIQHIWSYLSELNNTGFAMGIDQKLNNQNHQLFVGFLASQFPDKKNGIELIEIYRAIHINPKVTKLTRVDLQNIVKEWRSICENSRDLILARVFGEESGKESINRLREQIFNEFNLLDENIKSWSDVVREIAELVSRALDRANLTFSDIGCQNLLRLNRSSARNPPDLMFDNMPNSSRLLGRITSSVNPYRDANDFNRDFDKIGEDCHEKQNPVDDREELYFKNLLLAALFASADRWFAAEQHAKNATELIARFNWPDHYIVPANSPKYLISGREAWYLRSVAKRVRATTAADFAEARQCLIRSETAFDFEVNKGFSPSIPVIRYRNELLAINISQYFYNRYKSVQQNLDTKHFYGREVSSIYKLANELNEEKSKLTNAAGYSQMDRAPFIRVSTRVLIAVNLMQVKIIEVFRTKMNRPELKEKLHLNDRDMIDCISDIYEFTNIKQLLMGFAVDTSNIREPETPSIICTDLMLRYVSIIALIFAKNENDVWKPSSISDVKKMFAQQASADYDQSRYQRLHEFTHKYLLE